MNKFLTALAMVAVMFNTGWATKPANDKETETMENQSKVLVAYFSATGTTQAVAEAIAESTDATLYEIVPEPRYTDADLDWRDKHSRSSVEMTDASCRPAIGGEPIDVAEYDIVFIGYPIWWDLAPRQVNTFIEKYDFSGKKIIPFATSGGSTINNSVADLKRLYLQYDWTNGKMLNSTHGLADWAKSQVK